MPGRRFVAFLAGTLNFNCPCRLLSSSIASAKLPASPQHQGLAMARPIAIPPDFLFYWISFPPGVVRNLSCYSHLSTLYQGLASSYSHQIIPHLADLQMELVPLAGGYVARWR